MAQIIFATCDKYPLFSEGDEYLANALEKLGHTVTPIPWDKPFDNFKNADLILLRSNWDYHLKIDKFKAWLDKIEELNINIQNPLTLVRWNLHKKYLIELRGQGVSIPKTVLWNRSDDLAQIFNINNWKQAVLKPVYGANGDFVELVELARINDWINSANKKYDEWLVQEFITEIQESGELNIVFLNGEHAYTIKKTPPKGEYRVNAQFGREISKIKCDASIIDQAQQILSLLLKKPLYARIDGFIRDKQFYLSEVEVNEPALYFQFAPEHATNLAEKIHQQYFK